MATRTMQGVARSPNGVFSAVLTALTVMLACASGAAADPVALVVGIERGSAVPAMLPFSEVRGGVTLALEPQARLTFLHYGRCEQVTVESGAVTFGATDYRVVGGAIVSRETRPCPRAGDGGADEVGGVVLRSGSAVAVPVQPTFVLTGSGAGAVARLRVSDAAGQLAEAPVSSNVATFPVARAGLRPGDAYDLELVGPGGDPLRTIRIAPRAGADGPVLLRVD